MATVVLLGSLPGLLSLSSLAQGEMGFKVAREADALILSWPALTQNHWLESTSDLVLWTEVSLSPTIAAGRKSLSFPLEGGSRFFRLTVAVLPGPDRPDDSFTDTNGDGFDGDLANSIFVAPAGSDTIGNGLAPATPCRTIAYGLDLALTSGRSDVCVQAGDYLGSVSLVDGVSIYGGYDRDWLRGPCSLPEHRVRIIGGSVEGEAIALRGVSVGSPGSPVTIAELEISGADATTTVNGLGRSSYVLWFRDSHVSLHGLSVVGGRGADGADGGNGTSASDQPQASGNGANGVNASSTGGACSTSRSPGGAPGSSSEAGSSQGGAGGDGGAADTNCSLFSRDVRAQPGSRGRDASITSGEAGQGGTGGPVGGPAGGHGHDGLTTDGLGGMRATVPGSVQSAFWFGSSGASGTLGVHGGGGGGGGGSAGSDQGVDYRGASGGGGGAGGQRAPAAGTGGRGAGSSIGIFAIDTTLLVTDCTIARGIGGRGGDGGDGGSGQPGGLGGAGGLAAGGAAAGGNGGNGGRGGHSGGGAGGTGGSSWGIATRGGSLTTTDHNFVGGQAGQGGREGGAPGVPGESGLDGAVAGVVDLLNPIP